MTRGDLVKFGDKHWWIYEIKGDDVVILPEENLDYEEELLKLDGAIQVKLVRVKPYEAP